MLSQKAFDQAELDHGCGYWNICSEHSCPCAITTENKGLQESIWNSLFEEGREAVRQYEKEKSMYEFDWD